MSNIPIKFIAILCDGFMLNPDDSDTSLVTLEEIASQMPPHVYDQIVPDDLMDLDGL